MLAHFPSACYIGLVVYRSLTLAALWRILNDTAVSSAVVMLIVGFAGLYAWAGSTMGVIDRMTQGLLGLSKSPVVILWTITPPVAVNLYVAANVARLSVEAISRAVWPFVLAMLLALGIVVQWPALSTWLPGIFGLK